MREASGDARYEGMISIFKPEQNKEGEITMCGLLDKYETRGIQKGMERGVTKGRICLQSLWNVFLGIIV